MADIVEKVCSTGAMVAGTKPWFKDCCCLESSLLTAIDARPIVSRDLGLRTFSTVSARTSQPADGDGCQF
jgi:hypothetical protein